MQLLVVAVLYRCRPSESPTVRSLHRALEELPGLPVSVLLFDNGGAEETNEPRAFAADWEYRQSPANVGVAGAYQFALTRAVERGASFSSSGSADLTVDSGSMGLITG